MIELLILIGALILHWNFLAGMALGFLACKLQKDYDRKYNL